MLDFEESLADHVLIASTILATPLRAGFNKVTEITDIPRRLSTKSSVGLFSL